MTKTKNPALDANTCLRDDLLDLDLILDNLDNFGEEKGRNDAILNYMYALRDLQRACDLYNFVFPDNEVKYADIGAAEAKVRQTFAKLIECQNTVFREWRRETV
jgi:hypothetical protein